MTSLHAGAVVRRALIAIVALSCTYNAATIARMSFVVNGERYFLLADDQMISMRYADNLARGYGLVWNPGDAPLEGYTNFLWVVLMAVVHWLGIDRPVISLFVQLTGALFLVATLYYVKRLTETVTDRWDLTTIIAVAFSAFYLPLNNWALLGTEVSALTLVVAAAAWMSVVSLKRDQPPSLLLPLLLGVSTLIRLDMAVVAAAILSSLGVLGTRRVRGHVLASLAIVGFFLLAQTVARIEYFGDPLPNTYYLKLTGFPLLPRLSRGLFVTVRFVIQSAPLLVPVILGGVLIRPRREMVLLLTIVAIQLAYNIWIGGDAWEWLGGSNRFVAIVMPLVFVLVAAGFERMSSASGKVRDALDAIDAPALNRGKAFAMAALTIVSANYLALAASPDPVRRMFLIDRSIDSVLNERRLRNALALREMTDDDAVVGVLTAGIIPYFSERRSIDLLGKMDAHVARQPMHVPDGRALWTGFLPGHLKWDYEYSIGQLRPDVVQGSESDQDDAPPDVDMRDYDEVVSVGRWYVRRDSPHIRWNRFTEDGRP